MSAYPIPLSIVRSCWLIFAVVWVLAALFTKRTVYRESRWQRLRYSLLLVAGCVLLFRGYRLPYPLNARLFPQLEMLAWVAAMLSVAGLGFCLWARMVLGRNWSGTIKLKEGHELIERGPYRLVRHPIYTGLLAMCVGVFVMHGHVGGVVGLTLVFVSLRIKLSGEEAVMLKQFPGQYGSYQARAKRLIPFVF